MGDKKPGGCLAKSVVGKRKNIYLRVSSRSRCRQGTWSKGRLLMLELWNLLRSGITWRGSRPRTGSRLRLWIHLTRLRRTMSPKLLLVGSHGGLVVPMIPSLSVLLIFRRMFTGTKPCHCKVLSCTMALKAATEQDFFPQRMCDCGAGESDVLGRKTQGLAANSFFFLVSFSC